MSAYSYSNIRNEMLFSHKSKTLKNNNTGFNMKIFLNDDAKYMITKIKYSNRKNIEKNILYLNFLDRVSRIKKELFMIVLYDNNNIIKSIVFQTLYAINNTISRYLSNPFVFKFIQKYKDELNTKDISHLNWTIPIN